MKAPTDRKYQHDYYLRHREELLPRHRISWRNHNLRHPEVTTLRNRISCRNYYNRQHHPEKLPELFPERRIVTRTTTGEGTSTARRDTFHSYTESANYRGSPCKECGEIIEVYSRSGYCRDCWHWQRLMSRPTAEGRKCWHCGNQVMKIYKTNKGKCFLKCTECGATDNE